jgi:predicted nucleic acid-binding Zn ribbon protein
VPVYVYRDTITGETFTFTQAVVDPPLDTDPETGNPVVRVPQPITVTFRGEGFARNDLRTKKGSE